MNTPVQSNKITKQAINLPISCFEQRGPHKVITLTGPNIQTLCFIRGKENVILKDKTVVILFSDLQKPVKVPSENGRFSKGPTPQEIIERFNLKVFTAEVNASPQQRHGGGGQKKPLTWTQRFQRTLLELQKLADTAPAPAMANKLNQIVNSLQNSNRPQGQYQLQPKHQPYQQPPQYQQSQPQQQHPTKPHSTYASHTANSPAYSYSSQARSSNSPLRRPPASAPHYQQEHYNQKQYQLQKKYQQPQESQYQPQQPQPPYQQLQGGERLRHSPQPTTQPTTTASSSSTTTGVTPPPATEKAQFQKTEIANFYQQQQHQQQQIKKRHAHRPI